MLDVEIMQEEYARSYVDKTRIYFIEKYYSTFSGQFGKMIPIILFPRQKVFLISIRDNKATIAIKPRQSGISTITSAWAAAQCVFASTESPETILCIANKLEQAQELLVKICEFLDQTPRWFWGEDFYSDDPKSENNKRSIYIKKNKSKVELFNGCVIHARAASANAARGISAVSILIFDEAAFIEEGPASYASAVAATSSVPNSKIIMVSTPNGKDQLYFATYRQALAHENNYNAVEFRWYQDPRYNKGLIWTKKNENGENEVIKEKTINEQGDIEYNEEHWDDMIRKGYTPFSEWYDMMCKSFNNDSIKIAQELDVSFMGSADNVVDPEYINMQERLNVKEPLTDFNDPMVEESWFWKAPIDGHRYILACLPKGEEVLTQRGMVKVEDIKKDDLLVTKEGLMTGIKKKMVRHVDNEDVIEIIPYGNPFGTKFTWNHKIWCSTNTKLIGKTNKHKRYWDFNFSYVQSRDIKEGDWLVIPNYNQWYETPKNEILEYWHKYDVSDSILTKDFWWYCGMWLAEGTMYKDEAKDNTIVTTHSIKENEIHESVLRSVKAIIGKDVKKNENGKSSINLYFTHKGLRNFLKDTFGVGSKNKRIAEWVKRIPEEFIIELLRGYFMGDGCMYSHSKGNCVCFTSISYSLLKDVQQILHRFGIISSLKVSKKEHYGNIMGRECHMNEKYELSLSNGYTYDFTNLLGIPNDSKPKNRRTISYSFFSDDKKFLYIRIKKINKSKYTGNVYNFTTESESHSYLCDLIPVSNCDPSRGSAADSTAIEVIDMDGRDENNMPIIEQVMEFVGKKFGDEVGRLLYRYGTLYNNAHIVVDATGGQGDAAILSLLSMGYKNLYYEDMVQKTYTIQNQTNNEPQYENRLPGFHFQGNRYPVLAGFAGDVKNNAVKIRSVRVINQLDTWIFKGDSGRMDHMNGAHDDCICALAMALFVMKYSFNKIEAEKAKDAAILKSYMSGGGYKQNTYYTSGKYMKPTNTMPFFSSNNITKKKQNINGQYLWLFAGTK